MIGDAMGIKPDIVHIEPKAYQELGVQIFPYEWSPSHLFSTDKAQRDLRWSPAYHMADGLAMTYRWWVEQGLDKEPWDFSNEDEAVAAAS